MVIQHNGPIYQIIRREPGEETGEERVQTSGGTWWDTVDHLPIKGTGDRHAVSLYNIVVEV